MLGNVCLFVIITFTLMHGPVCAAGGAGELVHSYPLRTPYFCWRNTSKCSVSHAFRHARLSLSFPFPFLSLSSNSRALSIDHNVQYCMFLCPICTRVYTEWAPVYPDVQVGEKGIIRVKKESYGYILYTECKCMSTLRGARCRHVGSEIPMQACSVSEKGPVKMCAAVRVKQ